MTTTSAHRRRSHLQLDLASLALLVVGVVFGLLSYWLITDHGATPLVLIPSVVAATVGGSHLVKRTASRR